MNPSAKLICLVTPGHLASTPRLVKEADALHAAGYRVHVVHGSHFAPNIPRDDEIADAAPWERTAVAAQRGPAVFVRKLRRRIARRLLVLAPFATPQNAARAHHAETLHLAAVAGALRADYYIGHCLAGLAAAALAAEEAGAKFGFDLEDLHDAETREASEDRVERTATRLLQATYLPQARHLTAAAPLIAEEYERRYAAKSVTVLNTFPLRHAPAQPFTPEPIGRGRPAQLYWFSQTIGPQRGLEQVVAILGRLRTPAQLHLRGHVSSDYMHELNALAAREGVRMPIVYSPFAAADEMVRLAATADLGLSTEQHEPFNRDICLANKIFVYLLAGLPQLMTDTRAHLSLAPELGAAALVADFAQPDAVAARLDVFFADPAQVAAARATAWRHGRERFNWDREQETFLRVVKKAAGKP
jgi:glycosyltransferase involved in cell wall biosynthesis